MNAPDKRNILFSLNYATILHSAGYSKKNLRKIHNLKEVIETNNHAFFCKYLAEVYSIQKQEVSNTYYKFKALFENFKEKYKTVYIDDPLYPKLLKDTEAPPLFLYCQGEINLFNEKKIAIVGTRNPSESGVRRAQKLAMLLAANKFVIVSGLAKGIDTAAHNGAIRAGGKTIAVIGTPLDKSYPKENTDLQKRISKGHLLVSQFNFGHKVAPWNFPTRNYTMSGISNATVVIEASETSGALIQARQCMEQKHHLFILRNLLDRSDLKWPSKLRDKGAFVIEKVEDVPSALEKLPEYKLDNKPLNNYLAKQESLNVCGNK